MKNQAFQNGRYLTLSEFSNAVSYNENLAAVLRYELKEIGAKKYKKNLYKKILKTKNEEEKILEDGETKTIDKDYQEDSDSESGSDITSVWEVRKLKK